MVSDPGDPELFAQRVESILLKPVLLSQVREGAVPFLWLGARKCASRLPGWISPHLSQALLSLGEHRVGEGASSFQMGTKTLGLSLLDRSWQVEQKGRGGTTWFFLPGRAGGHPFLAHASEYTRSSQEARAPLCSPQKERFFIPVFKERGFQTDHSVRENRPGFLLRRFS